MGINRQFRLICLLGLCLLLPFLSVPPTSGYTEHRPLWSYDLGTYVAGVDISADGSYIAAGRCPGYVAGDVAFFSRASATPLWSIHTSHAFEGLALSAEGDYLAIGCLGAVFSCNTSKPSLQSLYTGSMGMFSVDICEGGIYGFYGRYIAATNGSQVLLYGITGPFIKSFTLDGNAQEVVISTNGSHIAAISYVGSIYLFDQESHTTLWSYKVSQRSPHLAISADGRYVVAGCYDRKIYAFNQSGLVWNYTIEYKVYAVSISANGQYIAGGTGVLYFFNRTSPIPLWNFSFEYGDNVQAIALSANGHYMAVGTTSYIYLFTHNSSLPLWQFSTGCDTVQAIAISADGQYIAAGTYNGKVYLFHYLREGTEAAAAIPGYLGAGVLLAVVLIISFQKIRIPKVLNYRGRR